MHLRAGPEIDLQSALLARYYGITPRSNMMWQGWHARGPRGGRGSSFLDEGVLEPQEVVGDPWLGGGEQGFRTSFGSDTSQGTVSTATMVGDYEYPDQAQSAESILERDDGMRVAGAAPYEEKSQDMDDKDPDSDDESELDEEEFTQRVDHLNLSHLFAAEDDWTISASCPRYRDALQDVNPDVSDTESY